MKLTRWITGFLASIACIVFGMVLAYYGAMYFLMLTPKKERWIAEVSKIVDEKFAFLPALMYIGGMLMFFVPFAIMLYGQNRRKRV